MIRSLYVKVCVCVYHVLNDFSIPIFFFRLSIFRVQYLLILKFVQWVVPCWLDVYAAFPNSFVFFLNDCLYVVLFTTIVRVMYTLILLICCFSYLRNDANCWSPKREWEDSVLFMLVCNDELNLFVSLLRILSNIDLFFSFDVC